MLSKIIEKMTAVVEKAEHVAQRYTEFMDGVEVTVTHRYLDHELDRVAVMVAEKTPEYTTVVMQKVTPVAQAVKKQTSGLTSAVKDRVVLIHAVGMSAQVD